MRESFLTMLLAQAGSMTDASEEKNSSKCGQFFIHPPWQARRRPPLCEDHAGNPGSSTAAPTDTDLASRLVQPTEQQSRVLALLAEGLLNKQTADHLTQGPDIHFRKIGAYSASADRDASVPFPEDAHDT